MLRPFIGWLLEERRLAIAESFGAGVYHNRPTPDVFTRRHPDCRAVELRQRVKAQEMRNEGKYPKAPISAGWAHDSRAYWFQRTARG